MLTCDALMKFHSVWRVKLELKALEPLTRKSGVSSVMLPAVGTLTMTVALTGMFSNAMVVPEMLPPV